MARITYFVALPFEYNGEGELAPGEARARRDQLAATIVTRRRRRSEAPVARVCPLSRA
jgi:hypothetical protein